MFVLNVLNLLAQTNSPCFVYIKARHDADMATVFRDSVKFGDTTEIATENKLFYILQETKKEIVGCKYPCLALTSINGKVINVDKIKTDYTIINFNYRYDGNSLQQIDELDSLKKELKNRITIICLSSNSKEEIQAATNKYDNNIEFVTETNKYMKQYNLGLGTPTTFVLDKTKTVKFVTSGIYQANETLYTNLKEHLK